MPRRNSALLGQGRPRFPADDVYLSYRPMKYHSPPPLNFFSQWRNNCFTIQSLDKIMKLIKIAADIQGEAYLAYDTEVEGFLHFFLYENIQCDMLIIIKLLL